MSEIVESPQPLTPTLKKDDKLTLNDIEKIFKSPISSFNNVVQFILHPVILSFIIFILLVVIIVMKVIK